MLQGQRRAIWYELLCNHIVCHEIKAGVKAALGGFSEVIHGDCGLLPILLEVPTHSPFLWLIMQITCMLGIVRRLPGIPMAVMSHNVIVGLLTSAGIEGETPRI